VWSWWFKWPVPGVVIYVPSCYTWIGNLKFPSKTCGMAHYMAWQYIFSGYLSGLFIYVGRMMAQLVEALCYKREGHGFDSWWCLWNFSLTQSFWPHCGPEVDSASNRNEYQEYFLRVGLTTLPPTCADCLEISEPHPPGTLRPVMGLLCLCLYIYICVNSSFKWPVIIPGVTN